MADTVGDGIVYEVSADVSKLLKAEKAAKKAIDDVTKEFDKAAKSNNKFDAQLKKTAQAVGRQNDIIGMTADEIEIYDAALSGATKKQLVFIKALQQQKAGMGKVNKAANDNSNGLKQVTMQLSQVAQQGQATGQWAQAFGLQLADIAIVAGVGGPLLIALASVAGVLAGPLITALTGANKKMEEMLDNLDEMEGGFKDLTEAEKAYIALQTSKRILELEKSIKELDGQTKVYTSTIERNEKVSRQRGFSTEKATEKNIEARAAIAGLQKELEKLNQIQSELNGGSTKAQIDNVNALIQALERESEMVGKNARQKALMEASRAGFGQESPEQAQINAIFDQIEAREFEQQRFEDQLQRRTDALKLARDQEAQIEKEREQAMNRYSNIASNAFTQTLSQTHSLSDATKEAARAIGQDMVSSLVKFAAQWAVNQAMQIAGIGATTSAQVASGAAITTAMAPAAATASVATAGGAPAAGLASLSAVIPAMLGLFAGMSGRATGGTASAGTPYKVTEHGTAEMFSSPMGNIFIPPSNGKIERNASMGGNTQVSLNISVMQEAGAKPADVTQTDNGVMIVGQAIKAVAAQVSSGNGDVANALRNNTTVQFKTRR